MFFSCVSCVSYGFFTIFPSGPTAVWRTEQRFLLRKKITEVETLISLEKPFILPAYAERHARVANSFACLLRSQSKGMRSLRGPHGNFLSSRFVDDQAVVSQFIDESAEETSAIDSGDSQNSDSDDSVDSDGSSSSGGGSSRSGASDPPLAFVSFPV
ncbi:unnamed protein product [Calypogeia fissa]